MREERGDMRQNEMDREEERKRASPSHLLRPCQLFYYHDVCAFITMPANKNLLNPTGQQLRRARGKKKGLQGGWVTLLTLCRMERNGQHVEDS